MNKLVKIMAVVFAVAFSFNILALPVTVEGAITSTAVGATNTIPNVTVGDWCTLEGLQVTWPATSTNTLTMYCVALNGVSQWAVTDTMVYTNDTAAAVTVSYNPTRQFTFTTTNTELNTGVGTTNNITTTVANLVTKPYVVKGSIKYVLARTGTASQTIYPVMFLKKD